MTRRDLWIGLGLAGFVLVVYVSSPNATPFDSRWTVHTALSLLREGNADLNEYVPELERSGFYQIECVLPDGTRRLRIASMSQCPGGKVYNFYPLGVPLFVAPAVGLLHGTLRAAQPWLAPLADRQPTEYRRALLRGELARASMTVELLLASLLLSVAAGLLYVLARTWLPRGPSALLTVLFAFATSAWSIGSRALWMHGFSMLLLTLALVCLRLERRWGWPVAGAALLYAFFVRPTNLIPLVALTAWVTWRHRARLLVFLAGMAPVALLFAALHFPIYRSPLPSYSSVNREAEPGLSLGVHVPQALAGNLISPSRGLFVYSPFLLFSLFGLWLWLRAPADRPWGLLCGSVIAGHYILICLYEDWFGGHGYGPRYFSDILPFLVLPLAPLLELRWRPVWWSLFAAAAAFSVFTHHQGAWCWPCQEWVSRPVEIRSSQWRLWDWRDPMFLRGFRPPASIKPATARPAR